MARFIRAKFDRHCAESIHYFRICIDPSLRIHPLVPEIDFRFTESEFTGSILPVLLL